MNKYQLTEDMAQDRKYGMTKIMAGHAQGDGQESGERCFVWTASIIIQGNISTNNIIELKS